MAWEFFDAVGRVKQAVFGPPVPMDIWHVVGAAGEPAFTGGWTNYGGTEQVASFRKFPDGRVRLRGLVQGGTPGAGSYAFTLPPGYRPPALLRFPISCNTLTGMAQVYSDGKVEIYIGNTGWTDLAGVEFDTATVLQMAGAPAGAAPLVAGLPTNPVDGQECMFLADAGNGVIWRLRYRAASPSAYKWEFCGGPDLVTPSLGSTSIGSVLVALSGQMFTVPLSGSYDIDFGASLLQVNNGTLIQVKPYVAGADSGYSARFITPSSGMNDYVSVMEVIHAMTLTAGQVVDLRAISASGGGTAYLPWMKLRPRRVG